MVLYMDNSLPPNKSNEIKKHLEDCEQCREWYLELQDLESIWKDPSLPKLEEHLTDSIMADIKSRPIPYYRRPRFNPIVKMGLASACALILFMYNGGTLFHSVASQMGMYNGHLAESITSLFHSLATNR